MSTEQKPRIEIRADLAVGQAGNRTLYADLYLPAQSNAESGPAVVLIFGGGWRSGEPSQQKVYGLALAKAGYVCLATDYRPSTEARWPAQLDDVQSAIRWLKAHSTEFNIDPERIAVSGNSSGGHLALMAAATMQESATGSQPESPVKAVCAFYPPTRLRGLDDESNDDTVRSLLGADATAADYDRASPLAHASQAFPPVLLLAGSEDQRVPVEHTWLLHEALQKAGNTVELHVFSGAGHAFDADRDFAFLSAAIMINFFNRYVGEGSG